jgi:hypothetical protein
MTKDRFARIVHLYDHRRTWLFLQEAKAGTLDITLCLFQNTLQVSALIFLFQRECNEWFNMHQS